MLSNAIPQVLGGEFVSAFKEELLFRCIYEMFASFRKPILNERCQIRYPDTDTPILRQIGRETGKHTVRKGSQTDIQTQTDRQTIGTQTYTCRQTHRYTGGPIIP